MNAVPQPFAGARRSTQVLLARHPRLYSRVIASARPGSVEKKVFLQVIREGDVVVDVGANDGYFTLLFSDIVGANGAVHAFEPVTPTFDRLVKR